MISHHSVYIMVVMQCSENCMGYVLVILPSRVVSTNIYPVVYMQFEYFS